MYRRQSKPHGRRFIDLTGQTCGRWNVLYYVGRHKLQTFWRCKCNCGTIGDVQQGNLTGGLSAGCNKCRNYHRTNKKNRTHGMGSSPEYEAWTSFKKRKQLVKEWHSFERFFRVVGKRPEGMRLCRINTQRRLGPDNWMWSTRTRKAPKSVIRKLLATKNRVVAIIDAREAGCTLREISEALGITKERVRQLQSYGRNWKPKGRGGLHQRTVERDKKIVKYFNDGLKTNEIAEILGISGSVISGRRQYLSTRGLVQSKRQEVRGRDDEIAKCNNDGLNTAEIAEFLNIPPARVSSRLDYLRLKGVVASKQQKMRQRDKDILKYYKQGLTSLEIGDILSVDPNTVLTRLRYLRDEGKIGPRIKAKKKKVKKKATKKKATKKKVKAKAKPKRKTKVKKKQRNKRK